MGKHSEWRKSAKKARRKRIRQQFAQTRDRAEEAGQKRRESSPTYLRWIEEQRKADQFQAEEESRLAAAQEAKWLKVEAEAQRQWRELQKKLEQAREERQKQNVKIKLEWEKEQHKLKELKEEKEREAERKRLEAEKLKEEIENFIANGGCTPEHLKAITETNPGKLNCPFFKKTSTCRFRDNCSRNHIRPGVSHVLLIPNFYSHYSLEQTENEHGSDSNLEFEGEELYNDFKEFFFDIVPELETCGRIKNLKVCCNHEAHLRGNVFVEYSQTREAVKAFRIFNGRYYGGKQLSVEFSSVDSWKSAICGLFFQKKCPKGNACNFLHVFKNPNNLFPHYLDKASSKRLYDSYKKDRRDWRWSESPERDNYMEKYTDDWEDRVPHDENGLGSRRRSSHTRSRSRRSEHRKRSHSRSTSRRSEHRKRSHSRSRSRRSEHRKRSHSRSRSRRSEHRKRSHSRSRSRSEYQKRITSKSESLRSDQRNRSGSRSKPKKSEYRTSRSRSSSVE